MSAAFWLATGQTVVFLAGTAFAYWCACRILDLLDAARTLLAHMEKGSQEATRAAIDARKALNVLREHWTRVQAAEQQPAPIERYQRLRTPELPTEPQPIAVPDTEPMHRAWDRSAAQLSHGHVVVRAGEENFIHDVELARAIAEMDDRIHDWKQKAA